MLYVIIKLGKAFNAEIGLCLGQMRLVGASVPAYDELLIFCLFSCLMENGVSENIDGFATDLFFCSMGNGRSEHCDCYT